MPPVFRKTNLNGNQANFKRDFYFMNNLLNHNGKQATIELPVRICNGVSIKDSKTWNELTDSNKQDITSKWIKDHIYTNVDQVMELLAQNQEHEDYDDCLAMSENKDFTYAVESDLQDRSIDELIEIINEYELDVDHGELFKEKYLTDLLENTNNTDFSIKGAFHELEVTFLQSLDKTEKEYTQEEIEKELLNFFTDNYKELSFDDLDTCITNLNINFNGYLNAYQSDLVSLIEKDLNYDQYGEDNDLDPEYDQAYEFYAVSDHFKAMLPENCEDLLGLTVWARFCTGQSLCLDSQIQKAAFKVLSDCSYKYY